MKISKDYLKKTKPDPHLHSPSHALADELANKLGDSKHFGFYLKTAMTTDHNVLRKLAGEVTEGNASNAGALFAFLLKKHKRQKETSDGYSVWLLPEPNATRELAQAVQSLAQTFDAPIFQPHITLIGGLEKEDFSAFAKLSSIAPFTVNAKSPASGNSFWSALHLPIIKNKELLAARRAAKKAFGVNSNDKFAPHLSLLYANLPDEQKLEAVKTAIPNPPKQLVVNRLLFVKTTGHTEDFQILKTIDLMPPK